MRVVPYSEGDIPREGLGHTFSSAWHVFFSNSSGISLILAVLTTKILPTLFKLGTKGTAEVLSPNQKSPLISTVLVTVENQNK